MSFGNHHGLPSRHCSVFPCTFPKLFTKIFIIRYYFQFSFDLSKIFSFAHATPLYHNSGNKFCVIQTDKQTNCTDNMTSCIPISRGSNKTAQDINSPKYEGNHLYFTNMSICTQNIIKYTHTNL